MKPMASTELPLGRTQTGLSDMPPAGSEPTLGVPRVHLRHDSVAWNEIDDSIVMLDLEQSTYFSVNSSGRVLWRLLSTGTTKAELAAALVENFGISGQDAERDVSAFLAELEAAKLVESER
jgi:hypothetical protein